MNIIYYGIDFSIKQGQGRYCMNNITDQVAPVIKTTRLAIVKRIDEIPGWEKKVRKRVKSVKNTKKPTGQPQLFESWIMPEMPEGYIKAKEVDFF